MKLTIITHVIHQKQAENYLAYAPYVREMNIWLKYVDEVLIVAPLQNSTITEIDLAYEKELIDFRNIPSFNLNSFSEIFKTIFKIPVLLWQIFKAMQEADHIHLRCPGNVGLLGCLVQVLFPSKQKTAKYAGNWDPKANQPWSYRLQKWILSNTFLTKNMQVLVYGQWPKQSKNIKPFFTATYSESEKEPVLPLTLNETIRFVFVGSLVSGKNPLYAIQLVENLKKQQHQITLNLYGEGIQRELLENYIRTNKLEEFVFLCGNQNKEVLKEAYQRSHFVILPSKSEGWPKAIAEGMFWGCVPLATKVSCVSFMLKEKHRGILLGMNLKSDTDQVDLLIQNEISFQNLRNEASKWSRAYTIDEFRDNIKEIFKKS